MGAWDLTVGGAGWLHLLGGVALLLLPGLAAADRLLPDQPRAFLLAPVFSLTLLPLGALLLAFLAGVPITAGATACMALAWTAVFGARRLHTTLAERLS